MHLDGMNLNPGSIFLLATLFCFLIILLAQWLKMCYVVSLETFIKWYENNLEKETNRQSCTSDTPATITEVRASRHINTNPLPTTFFLSNTAPSRAQHFNFKGMRFSPSVPRRCNYYYKNVVVSAPVEEPNSSNEDPPPSYDEAMGLAS